MTKVIKTKIASSKGNLSAAIHYPQHETERLAILCPGFLDSKDYTHLVKLADVLSEQGYTTVRFEPTGTWESEGDISDYTTTQYLEDIKNVLEYMLSQSNYEYLLLGGHSRGAQISVLYAARDPRISIVVSIMPSSKRTSGINPRYTEWKEHGFSVNTRDLPNDKTSTKEFRVPYPHVIDKDKYDVVQDVKQVNVPVIFIAGELDDLCSPSIVKEIFDNANEPKKFILISGIGHDYRFNDSEVDLVNKKILEELISMTENKC